MLRGGLPPGRVASTLVGRQPGAHPRTGHLDRPLHGRARPLLLGGQLRARPVVAVAHHPSRIRRPAAAGAHEGATTRSEQHKRPTTARRRPETALPVRPATQLDAEQLLSPGGSVTRLCRAALPGPPAELLCCEQVTGRAFHAAGGARPPLVRAIARSLNRPRRLLAAGATGAGKGRLSREAPLFFLARR